MSDLVEVYSILLLSDNGDDNIPTTLKDVEVEGGVVANDRGWIFLYNPEDGFDSILPDGTLHLTGPSRCIEGENWCTKLSLRDKHRKLELSRGYLIFSSISADRINSEPVSSVIRGKDGYAVVHSMSFKSAVQATVEVSLIPGSEASACYGHIRAHHGEHTNVYQKKYFRSTLFHASEQKPKELDGTNIQLSRSAAAVPKEGKLVVEAELVDSTTKSVIASGNVFFYAQTSSFTIKRIGRIDVKISWVKDPLYPLREIFD